MGTDTKDIAQQSERPAGPPEDTLARLHPAMFRNHPFQYLVVLGVFALGLTGVVLSLTGWALWGLTWEGQVPLWISAAVAVAAVIYWLGWWVQTRFITLKVTTERCVYRKGLISRKSATTTSATCRSISRSSSDCWAWGGLPSPVPGRTTLRSAPAAFRIRARWRTSFATISSAQRPCAMRIELVSQVYLLATSISNTFGPLAVTV